MYYKTFYKNNVTLDYSVDSLYAHQTIPSVEVASVPEKITVRTEQPFTILTNAANTTKLAILQRLVHNAMQCLNTGIPQYTQYRIPKTKGGFRCITAPSDELKSLQKNIYNILTGLGATAHNAAYAYEPHRTCKDAVLKHQKSNSEWFYKFDIKDFFPTCTDTLLQTTLKEVFPFCCLSETLLNDLIKVATYQNSLPQGSPLSPLLSNLVLTKFDYIMTYSVRPFNGTYTRYADDILISTPTKHELSFIQHIVQKHLNEVSPTLRLNKEKSRCGSKNGSNWNLGLMLNKDNNITLGHKRKMELKAKINNFIFDFTNQDYWSIIDTQVLQGEVNYFKTIEPSYASFVINRLEQKYLTNYTLQQMFHQIISGCE